MPNKRITIEGLARMIQKGFSEAQEDRAGIKGEMTEIKEDIKDIRNKLAGLERRIMFLEDKATEHSKELREIRILIQKLQNEKRVNRKKVVWLEKRVAQLETKAGI